VKKILPMKMLSGAFHDLRHLHRSLERYAALEKIHLSRFCLRQLRRIGIVPFPNNHHLSVRALLAWDLFCLASRVTL
jgi:hypothetical protein